MAECDCELSSQSKHPTPGLVEDGEAVVRLVFLPDQLDEHGCIKPTSLDKADLKRQAPDGPVDRGFSTSRERYVDPAVLQGKAKAFKERRPEVAEVQAFKASVAEIRALMIDGARALCVVDRALPDDWSHAECWGAQPGRGEAKLKKIRADLARLFKPASKVA